MLVKQLRVKQNNKNLFFSGMLLGTFGTSLLGNRLAGKGVIQVLNE